MASYQVKVEYGEKRFSTFLLNHGDLSLETLLNQIKKHCSPLSHLPSSNIRIRFRDEDGDMVNLCSDDDFSFQEMLRSAKVMNDRDLRKIYIQANEVDSPMPRKCRRTEQYNSDENTAALQPKHLCFTPTTPTNNAACATNQPRSPLDAQQKEIEDNLQVLKVQLSSAKEELAKLNLNQQQFRSLAEIRGRVCNNCHQGGHTKTTCNSVPCTDINKCKIKEKHPEEKQKITQLQREIKVLENKYVDEESNLKNFKAARERSKGSFFAVMRPRLKAQNMFRYGSGNRAILDRDLLVLQRALRNVPDWDESEDWRLTQIIEQYEKSNVNIYMPGKM